MSASEVALMHLAADIASAVLTDTPIVSRASLFDIRDLQHQRALPALSILIIVSMALYSIVVIVERLISFRRAKMESRAFKREASLMVDADIDTALAISGRYRRSPLALAVEAAIQDIQSASLVSHTVEGMCERARQRAIALCEVDLRKRLWILTAIGWTVPLVGFFGTVFEIFGCFGGAVISRSGGFQGHAGCLADSLVITVLGMAVAIPSIWTQKYLSSALERFKAELDHDSEQMIRVLVHKWISRFHIRAVHPE